MGKISGAIYEFHYMNDMVQKNNWLNGIHPIVKLIVTISYTMAVVSFTKYEVLGIVPMIIYPIILFNSIKMPFYRICKKVWPIFLLVCFIGLFNPLFDHIPIMKLGNFIITGGMISAITLMLKGILTVLASILLIVTTGIEGICYALRLLHIPNIFVTQILLTYRYIAVLLEEADQIYQAYSLRAPRQKGIHIKVWGSLLGQLLLRSIDRANILFDSMILRGYKGEFYYANKGKCTAKDYLYLFICLAVFIVLRCFSVLKLFESLLI
ncbi:cobalt ECF transporter T component CbiQ [Tissierella sp.]|uniref:cobalt ECF transporter T component CbiQ n=1 Tax=Tissierella sp. TaxID=41274 RepID=UPI003027AF76